MSHCECSVCSSELPAEEAIERVMLSILEHIRDVGFSVMGVFGDEEDPPVAYTIGLSAQGRPDLVVVGLDPRIGHAILACAEALDQPLEAGREYEGIAEGYRVRVIEPSPDVLMNMTWSQSYNQQLGDGAEFNALQIVWPDPQGRYPGDPGYDAAHHRQLVVIREETENVDSA